MTPSTSVLVTRPEGQGEKLCCAIRDAGFAAHSLPLMSLQPVTEPDSDQRLILQALNHYQHIVFVSANAVKFGMAWIGDYWRAAPTDPRWYAVGDVTARLLAEFGIEASTPGGAMSSEGLLALAELKDVSGQRVLIIKGEGGRKHLADVLQQRGAAVDELACYRRVPPDMTCAELAEKLRRWRTGLIMISSGEGFSNLHSILGPEETARFTHITFLVPSQRIAQMVGAAGFSRVITADNASDGAMLRALAGWSATSGE